MLLSLILVFLSLSSTVKTSIMPNPIGETIPEGDIYVESDGILEINCVLYASTADEEMKFISDQHNLSPYVNKINATAIRLHIKNPKPQAQMYYCLLGDQIVSQNFVFVIVKPSDMKCISYNYERLNCSFVSSELPSSARYEAKYTLTGRRYNHRSWTVIDNVTTINHEKYFVLDASTSLPYRSVYGEITMLLKISIDIPKYNIAKEYNLNATFDESKHVIPGAAQKIQVTTIRSDYVQIAYALPSKMSYITYPVKHKILWSCKCGEKMWSGKDSFNATTQSIIYNITDLPYAYALCNVSVYLKVAQAAYDNMWSNNSTIENIRTGSKVPENPPTLLPGAFQIDQILNQTYVIIYWKQVPEELKNGPNFNYEIILKGQTYEQIRIKERFAIIKNVNITTNVTIEVRSRNSEGVSKKSATVIIPKINDTVIRRLESFTQWTNSSGVTYLSWQLPKNIEQNITKDLVVFGCDNWNKETQLCYGQLETVNVIKSVQGNFYHIPKNTTNNKKYAVTFKTLRNWTGLLWSTCTIEDKSLPLPEIHLSIVDVGITKVGLKWTLNCKDMAVPIFGYVVSHCKASEQLEKCDGEIKNITIKGDRTVGHCEIENIDFDTRYLIWVTTESYFGKQQKSKVLPYFNECKPNSALIYWTIPIGIVFLIIAAFSSKKLYKRSKECWTVNVTLPSGLHMGSFENKINEKQFQWKLNTNEIPKTVPEYNIDKYLPILAQQVPLHSASVESLKETENDLKSTSKRYEEFPSAECFKDNCSKPYIHVIGINEMCNQSDEIRHPYVTSGTFPDIIQVPLKTKNKAATNIPLEDTKYTCFNGNVNIPSSYVVAGNCGIENQTLAQINKPYPLHTANESKKEQDNNSTIPIEIECSDLYVTSDNSEEDDSLNSVIHSYVIASCIDPTALKPQKTHYVSFEDFHNATEDVPLLQLPNSSKPHTVFKEMDTGTDAPKQSRPYVAASDFLRTTYSDTPA